MVIWSCISASGVRDLVWDHLINLLKHGFSVHVNMYIHLYIHMYIPVWYMYCIGSSVGHSVSCHCVLNLYSNTNWKVCESWKHLSVENLLFLFFGEFWTFLSHFVPDFEYNIKTWFVSKLPFKLTSFCQRGFNIYFLFWWTDFKSFFLCFKTTLDTNSCDH